MIKHVPQLADGGILFFAAAACWGEWAKTADGRKGPRPRWGKNLGAGKRILSPPGWIAPDLSDACVLHRPGYRRSPAYPNPAGWYIHGAAQNRRGTVLAVSPILGAPSFSPH